ncbi:FGGY-family carbohydrate kinase [Candidatus Bathyarchaeota archaeon]|nr:FGGY-family carbohydrate kinase [Candidatus Bathyarchaeota archaeon]
MSEAVIIVDLGSSNIRAYLIDSQRGIVASARRNWSTIVHQELELIVEHDPADAYAKIVEAVREVLARSNVEASKVIGISCISQRMSTVLLDEDGKELYMGPNRDSRGIMASQPSLEEADLTFKLSGHTPPFLFTPARLRWFREFQPHTAEKTRYIMTFHDWLIYRLTGKRLTEPSVSAETCLLNVKERRWSRELTDIYEIELESLPEIRRSGDIAGTLNVKAAGHLGLKEKTVVLLGGGDTQMGLLSARVTSNSEYGCVAGYTAPVVGVFDEVIIDEEMRVWTGCHSLGDLWTLEANPGLAGGLIEWFVNKFSPGRSYDSFMKLIKSSPVGSRGVTMVLSTPIMNAKEMENTRVRGLINIPLPILPSLKPVSISDLARGFVEYVAFCIKANYTLLEGVSHARVRKFGVTGGLTRIRPLMEALCSLFNMELIVTRDFDGSALACAVVCLNSLGVFESLENGLKNIVPTVKIRPSPQMVSKYSEAYTYWRQFLEEAIEVGR